MNGKRIAILGSTGSIGCHALEVIEHLGAPYRAVALSANQNVEKLIQQARRHRPAAVAVADQTLTQQLRDATRDLGCQVYSGVEGLSQMVCRADVDMVLAAIVGAAGLGPVLAGIRAGKQIALANKEALVVAGSLIVPEARRRGVQILPVDSEHSAVFQAMHCGRLSEVRRVILTASGGPFRCASPEQLARATPEDALNHPTWQMGSKITIDSATMFNKGLEIIEACWLFDLPPEKIEVVVHPESIVHSMVEFVDGSVIAQLSPPDMRTPIQYALTYPQRREGIGRRLDLSRALSLHFEPPDPQRFPALRLAYEAARQRGTAGAVLNAANEVAVKAFIDRRIGFGMISRIVELTIRSSRLQPEPSLDDLLEADRAARATAESLIEEFANTDEHR
ncbi:1-deoxy-D-xylulose-5-phosphate reductoisomerase [Fontivita pretiosa]|uniref:1-deoxy-D-xylulose-5-phosphate reductoisomerase n=1 Tax=Fontivita pretiosa TaxID=2989684 RepID=UPI003D16C07D